MQKIGKKLIQIGLLSWLVWIIVGKSALAQSSNIVADDTLNSEASLVQKNVFGLPIELIQGGAIRGINLFHSFQEFNVSEGRSAYFISPSADIQNIIARITGTNRSEIFGTLGTLQNDFSPSNANLFLINPQGIIFGENAHLDIGGSFVSTTADAVQFHNQGLFSADAPQVPQLLTINPSAFLFNQITPAPIINQSRAEHPLIAGIRGGINAAFGKNLLLLGGNIILDGGILTAFGGGKVELGGLAENGSVPININGNNFTLSFPDDVVKANILLTNQARIDTTGFGGGEINLVGKHIKINGASEVTSATIGNQDANAVKIQTEQLDILEQSSVTALTTSSGRSGDIFINAQTFNISGLSQIVNITNGTGNSGNIFIGTENINMNLGALIGTIAFGGSGNAGNVSIRANNSVNLNNTSSVSTISFASGNTNNPGSTGNLTIDAKTLNLDNASGIISSSFLGQGTPGNIELKILDSINLSNSRISAAAFSAASGGNISIETSHLNILNGSQINNSSIDPSVTGVLDFFFNNPSVTDPVVQELFLDIPQDVIDDIDAARNSSNFGQANSGNINIRATKSVVMSGRSTFRETQNLISTETKGAGKAGNLTLETGSLITRDSSIISTQTSSSGDGGNLTIKANAVELVGNSQIAAFSEGTGKAGNIDVSVNKNFNATNSSILTSSVQSAGGLINLTAENIRLFGNSDIRTNVFSGEGGGGNITLTANSIIALNDSDILSFARDGKGGDIQFNTRAFLSSPLYFPRTSTSDANSLNTLEGNQKVEVNASGAISGTITGIPDISFLQNSLTELPQNLIDTNALLTNTCIARSNNQQGGTFFVTGAGGLPERPDDAPLSPYSTGTIQAVSSENNSLTSNISPPKWKIGDPIVEPQGVYQLANGQRILSRECSY